MKKEQLYEAIGQIDEAYINKTNKSLPKSTNTWFSKSKWLKFSSIAACFCLMAVATILVINKIAPRRDAGEFSYIVTYAGWSEEPTLYENAFNSELIQSAPDTRLPVFKIDTYLELENFKQTYSNILLFDQRYDTVLSFYDAMEKAQFDREIFYQENSLLIIYVPANSCSLRFAIKEIKTTDTSMCVYIEQKIQETTSVADKAGWFICIKVNKDKISNYTSFDAVFDIK